MALMNVFVLLACLVVNRVSQVMNDAYKILSPAQEFYAKSVISKSPSTSVYFVFGGWFKANMDMIIPEVSYFGSYVDVEGPEHTLNKLLYDETDCVTIWKDEWIFVAWINDIGLSENTTAYSLALTPEVFHNVTIRAVVVNRGWSARSTGAPLKPFPVSNPGINQTFAFEYDKTNTIRSYVNLFYSFHDTETRMYRQLVSFMVGPYKGDILYYRGNKLNKRIAGAATLSYVDPNTGTWTSVMTDKLRNLTDRYGLYTPTSHYVSVNNFIGNDQVNNAQQFDTVRTVMMRVSFKLDVPLTAAEAPPQSMTLGIWIPSVTTTRVKLELLRSTSSATLKVVTYSNPTSGTPLYNRTKPLNFSIDGQAAWHHFTLKVSMIRSEPMDVPDSNSQVTYILLADVSHQQDSLLAIEYQTLIFSNVKWSGDWNTNRTVGVSHLFANSTPDLNNGIHAYLHTLVVMNGGMEYSESGTDSSYDKSKCLAATVVKSGNSMVEVTKYCLECIQGEPLDKNSGLCGTSDPIQGCVDYYSPTYCNYFDPASSYYNQHVLNTSKPLGTCTLLYYTATKLFPQQNMPETCSEVFPSINTTCTYFTDLAGPLACKCRIDDCKECVDTPCDLCQGLNKIEEHGRRKRCSSPAPSYYGLSASTNKYLPCLSEGCKDCASDYLECTSCDTSFVLTLGKYCMLCGPNYRRYFNPTTNICHICHPSCMTCMGPDETDCLTCPVDDPETRFYMNVTETANVTGYCVSCEKEQLYFNITKTQFAVGFVWDNSTAQPRCSWCNETCKTCANASSCTSCNASKYIQPYGHCDVCVLTEPNYIDGIYCRMCYYTCKTCNITDRNCTSCRDDNYLTVNNTCELCDMNCIGCSGTKKNCTQCRAGMYRYPHNGWCGYCYEEGFVLNETSGECVKCGNYCRYCNASNPNTCLSCIQNTFLFPINKTCGACDTKGKWYEESIFCKACDASCGTCTGGLATMCVNCDYPFEKVVETGRCEYTELLFTSSYYEKVMTYVVFPFETKVKIDGEVDESMEAAVFVDTTSLEEPLDALTFNTSLLTLPGIAPPTAASVTGIKVSGTSVIVQLSIVATVKNASVVLKFKKSGAIRAASSRTWKFINVSLVHTGITVIRSAFDSALDSAGSTAASAVAIITLPQALVLLKLLNCLGLYVFVDVEFPSNFNKLLEMLSTTVLDFVPNIFLPFADDEGQPLPERFAKYDIEVHFFKNFGPTLTVITGLCLIKLLTNPFKRCARSKKSMWLFRFFGKVYSFLSLDFWVTLLESVQFDYVLSLCIYLTSRRGVDEWKPTNYLIILGLSASSLSLLTFYCFLTYKTRKLTEAYYKHAILPVEMMKDEPFKFILEDKALPGNVFQRYFTVVGLLKDLFTCLVVYFCVTQPVVVTSLMSLTQFAFTLGVIVTPPYSLRKDNMLLTIESVLYTVLNMCLLVLALGASKLNSDFKYYFIGFLLCAVTVLLIISNIGFTLYYTAVEIKKKCRAFKAKKADKQAVTETSGHGLSDHSIVVSSSLHDTKMNKRLLAKPLSKKALALEVEDSMVSKHSRAKSSAHSPRKLVIQQMHDHTIIKGREKKNPSANELDTLSKQTTESSQFNRTQEPEHKDRRLRVKPLARKRLLLGVPASPSIMQTEYPEAIQNDSVDNSGNSPVRVKRRVKGKKNNIVA